MHDPCDVGSQERELIEDLSKAKSKLQELKQKLDLMEVSLPWLMVEHAWTWLNMVEHGWTWLNMVGWTWLNIY